MAKWKRKLSLPRRWQRNHLIAKYGTDCYLCGEPMVGIKEMTIDHWMPLSRGGSDAIENYRLAHERCNGLKADLSPEEFLEFQKGTIQWES